MPHVELPQAEFKVALLGDANAGKTSLVLRFAEGYYREAGRSSTVGAFFITKRIQTSTGITCKIQCWDTAGQAKFRPMAPMYYRNAAAAIVCYDVTCAQSYKVMREWLDELHRNVPAGSIVIAIASTKCDLTKSQEPAVPFSEAEKLAQALGAIYVDTSAKENFGVTELFQRVAERVLRFRDNGSGLPVTPGASINENGKVVNGGTSPRSVNRNRPRVDTRDVNEYSPPTTPPLKNGKRDTRGGSDIINNESRSPLLSRYSGTAGSPKGKKAIVQQHAELQNSDTSTSKAIMCGCGIADPTTTPGVVCEKAQACIIS